MPMLHHDSPEMLYAIEASGAKRCRLCGEVYSRASQGYHSHAAKHIREGKAQPVATTRYRRWYRMTPVAFCETIVRHIGAGVAV